MGDNNIILRVRDVMPLALYISTVKGSKVSRVTMQSDEVIEIVSSDDDGSESSEEEGLGAGLKEMAEEEEEGEASSDMQLSDQEQGQRSNGGLACTYRSPLLPITIILPSICEKFIRFS
jgi:hypothetical protein